jgi:adenylate cyclase
MKNRSWMLAAVPVGVIAVMGVLVWLGLTRQLELQILDLYTHLVPPPPTQPEVVIIDADDEAMQNVGVWPWSRDVHANLLADLRSLGTDSLSFDVEFVDRGPVGVNSTERDGVIKSQSQELDQVFQAWKDRQMTAAEVQDAAHTLLSEGVLLTARDNDAFLGQSMAVFGKAFTTLNYDLTNDSPEAKDAFAYLNEHSTIPATGDIGSLAPVETLRGAIVPVASHAAGASVTNVQKDPDGTLRRINLLFRLPAGEGKPDRVFGQMAFVPVWNRLGRPAIEVSRDKIVLKTSALANPRPDIVIPLDPRGRMVINWPHARYWNTFTHVRVSELQTLRAQEASLAQQVQAMQDASYLTQELGTAYAQARDARATALAAGDQKGFDAAEAALTDWRNAVVVLSSGVRENELKAVLKKQAADPKIPKASRDKIPALVEDIGVTFKALGDKARAYLDHRATLEHTLKGALAFYGWTAIATTDLGVTPFDSVYYNVGTHAAVANTILSGSFLNEWPSWLSFLLGALVALGASVLMTRLGTLPGVLVGFGVFLALIVAVGVGYVATGVYAGALVPGGTVFLSILGLTLVRFWGSEAEKRYIRGAFSTYLSPDVIKQLEADPDKLKLGGEKKFLTAMFTDVKGFSTISESMDPNDLVSLLNLYLTRMCDLILDARGTIDKFEGDAIIAFWGAPLAFDDHAMGAARSALRMKQAEALMNEQLVRDRLSPSPLLTRIGINTGDMTVGNMGTARRMNYTMMGNAVNLAARLEGVNKQYGTWILTTEATRGQLDESIVVRKLDRVRVVGIHTPVRLFEVVSFRDQTDGKRFEKIGLFEEGIDAYETRDWERAIARFRAVLAIDPDDGPAKTFLERTDWNQAADLGPDWDGVFTLTTK